MSIEIMTLQVVMPKTSATGRDSFKDGIKVGATYSDVDQNSESTGEIEYGSERGDVQINRTPTTQAEYKAGRTVKWRDELWRIQDRTEANGRTAYNLSLERVT